MGYGFRRGASSALAGLLVGLLSSAPAGAQWTRVSALSSRIAVAQPQPKVVVVVVALGPQAEEAAGRIDYVARQAVQRSGRFELVRLMNALDAEKAKAREVRVEEATKALEDAKVAINELDSPRALAETNRAIKLFGEADLTLHMKKLSNAWTYKILALVGNAETKAARMEMEKLLAIDPGAEFSPNLFPPDELAAAEKIRKELARGDQKLEVKTSPAGAEIYVDGRFQGISPLTVDGLPAGDHYVTAKAPGYTMAQQKVAPGAVEITLERAEAWPRYEAVVSGVRRDPHGAQRDAAAREFGRWLGVDQVILGVVSQKVGARELDLMLLRLDPKDGHNYAYLEEAVPTGPALLQQVDALVTSLLAQDEPRRGGPVTHFDGPGGDWKKTAGYVLLGTGAAALVAGVTFGVMASGKSGEFHSIPQTDPRAQSVASQGRTYAVVADLSVLVGLVAGGAGGYLAFAPEKSKAPDSSPAAEARVTDRRAEEEAGRRAQGEAQRGRDDDDFRED